MAAVVNRTCKYVAVLTPSMCVIHNWADATEIARRVVTAENHGMLATRCFPTQKDALCWLTNPVHTEAMAAAAALVRCTEPVVDDCYDEHIAVVTRSSSSCFGIDSASVAPALAMVRDPLVGACVFRRFASKSLAWRWLVGDAGRCLLEVVGWPQGDGARPVRRIGGIPGSTKPGPASTAASARSIGGPARDGRPPPPSADDCEFVSSSCASWTGGSHHRRPRHEYGATPLGKRTVAPSRSFSGVAALGPGEGHVSGISSVARERRVAVEPPMIELDLTDGGRNKRRRLGMSGRDDLVRPRNEPPPRAGRSSQWSASDASDLLQAARQVVTPDGGAGCAGSSTSRGRAASGARHLGIVPQSAPSFSATPDDHTSHPDRRGQSPRRGLGRRGQHPAFSSGRFDGGDSDGLALSPDGVGPIGLLAGAGRWDEVCEQLFARVNSAFISGGPGAGKSTLLRRLHAFLRERYPAEGEVVVLAPTGTSAKTAGGMTYHSFFGFGRDYNPERLDPSIEAARLLQTARFRPIKARLSRVRAVLLDEVSLVGADKFGIMHELLSQARSDASRPCLWFAFGDFLQLGPVKGAMAFTAPCWQRLFGGSFLDLPGSFRQSDPAFIRAVRDARVGNCSDAVEGLVKDCWVDGSKYESMRYDVLHLMPHHKGVIMHNRACLQRLTSGAEARSFVAVDDVEQDPDGDVSIPPPALAAVSGESRRAALVDCVAPAVVLHYLHARVIINTNRRKALGVCHGSVGFISSYEADGTPVVRLDHHTLPAGVDRGQSGVHDAGDSWIEIACPPVKFTARILAYPGALAVRLQVPFVLGWATTIHMSQSLSISRAVLDLAECFEAGMVQTALSRVPTKSGLHIKSFASSRLRADHNAMKMYGEWRRL